MNRKNAIFFLLLGEQNGVLWQFWDEFTGAAQDILSVQFFFLSLVILGGLVTLGLTILKFSLSLQLWTLWNKNTYGIQKS